MAEKTALETVANRGWRSPSGRVFPPFFGLPKKLVPLGHYCPWVRFPLGRCVEREGEAEVLYSLSGVIGSVGRHDCAGFAGNNLRGILKATDCGNAACQFNEAAHGLNLRPH